MSRAARLVLPCLAVLALSGCGSSSDSSSSPSSSSDISGTRWVGTETCILGSVSCLTGLPSPVTYEFQSGGILRYTTIHGTFTTAVWSQSGNTVNINYNNGYNTSTGTISGSQMTGSGQNIVGYRYTYTVTRQ